MQIHFTDYAILSLLQAVLLLITLVDYKSTKRSEFDDKTEFLQKAAVTAFAGIILTLVSGIIVEFKFSNQQDFYFISVPALFILFWGGFYKKSTEMLNIERFENDMDKIYEQKILKIFSDDQSTSLMFTEIYKKTAGFFSEELIFELYRMVFSRQPVFFFKSTEADIKKLLEPFVLTKPRLQKILGEMEKKNMILFHEEKYSLTAPI